LLHEVFADISFLMARSFLGGGIFFLVYGAVTSAIYVAIFDRQNLWAGLAIFGFAWHGALCGTIGGPVFELVTWILAGDSGKALSSKRQATLGAAVFAITSLTIIHSSTGHHPGISLALLLVTAIAALGGAMYSGFLRLIVSSSHAEQ
jgi:hypothetical protein